MTIWPVVQWGRPALHCDCSAVHPNTTTTITTTTAAAATTTTTTTILLHLLLLVQTLTSCPARKTISTLRLLSCSSRWHRACCFVSSFSLSLRTSLSSASSRRLLACTSEVTAFVIASRSSASRVTSVLSRSLSSFSWVTLSCSCDTVASAVSGLLIDACWRLTDRQQYC